jgi:hypothetical protein
LKTANTSGAKGKQGFKKTALKNFRKRGIEKQTIVKK